MNFLHTEIGSAKDNQKSPVHNWYKFTAGFSYKFVEEIIALENLRNIVDAQIFDPFAGCGTTLVSCQKEEVKAIGNEAQSFMYDIIRGKLNWHIDEELYKVYLQQVKCFIEQINGELPLTEFAHPLLKSLYKEDILQDLYSIKDSIDNIPEEKYHLFFKLALSQTLHKTSIHPIAVPYISRNKTLKNDKSAWEVFSSICQLMFDDTISLSTKELTSKIYKQDSRKPNNLIGDHQCDICITSPPYLNNLDYGEVSKVHTHFFDITNTWNDITNRVRKNLVTGSTTHYAESQFSLEDFRVSEFAVQNPNIINELISTANDIKNIAKGRAGKKSFDILTLLYFQDMFLVLKEIKRVLKDNGKAYLILGDSAPYGVLIPTTEILGKIGLNVGFNGYEIHKIRSRGTKWKSLKNRHSIELNENVLVLK
jgi:DNA modification methylase